MNLWTMIFGVFVILMGLVAGLVYAAMQGSVLAIVAVSFLVFFLMFTLFQGSNLAFTMLRDRQESIRMKQDMHEDVKMMQIGFRALSAQANAQRQLSGPAQTSPSADITVEEDLFGDFKEVE